MEFFTIGVFNSEEKEFFGKLTGNRIDAFADIRHRRGVRGPRYFFANSKRLQQKLQELGISYEHVPGLAPTPEIRMLQQITDRQLKKTNKNRNRLSGSFVGAFKQEVLNDFDFDNYLQMQKDRGAERIVMFCVEEHPEACHRSIVAEKLTSLGYKVTHL